MQAWAPAEHEKNLGYFLTRDASGLTGPGPGDSAEDAAYFEPADDHVGGRLEGPFTSADVASGGAGAGKDDRRGPRTAQAGGRGWEFQHVMATVDARNQSYRFRMIVEPTDASEYLDRVREIKTGIGN